MSYSKGLCICLDGKDKDVNKDHGRVHARFDPVEDAHLVNGKIGTWTFAEANEIAATVCAKITGCNKKCLKHQTKQFYKAKNVNDNTVLRADSTGVRGDLDPSIMGTKQKKWFFGLL